MELTAKLAGEKARDYAYRILCNNIVLLKMEPGSQIVEHTISSALGISRTPVREALLELEKIRLVDIYPQRGSFVSKIDYNLVEEAIFVRLSLEKAVVELDCEIDNPDIMEKLKENILLQNYYSENRNIEKSISLDNEFHAYLFEMANKQQASRMVQSLMTHFDRLRSLRLKNARDKDTIKDHEAIIKAIEEKNKKEAAAAMQAHLTRHHFDIEELKSRYGQYFK